MQRGIHWGKLLVSILLSQAAGVVGSVFTAPNIEGWYNTLAKPSLNPPSWVFAPVWTILYTMMGLALYIIWVRHVGGHRRVFWLRLFLIHLAVNALWSIVFFGQHALGIALAIITVLWVLLLTLIIIGFRLNRIVAYLLMPYLAWVSFASYLNYAIWSLNR